MLPTDTGEHSGTSTKVVKRKLTREIAKFFFIIVIAMLLFLIVLPYIVETNPDVQITPAFVLPMLIAPMIGAIILLFGNFMTPDYVKTDKDGIYRFRWIEISIIALFSYFVLLYAWMLCNSNSDGFYVIMFIFFIITIAYTLLFAAFAKVLGKSVKC